jgi:hypothetical protein
MSLLFDIWLLTGLSSGLLDEVLAEAELNGDDFGMYSLLRAPALRAGHPDAAAPLDGSAADHDLGAPQATGEAWPRGAFTQPARSSLPPGRLERSRRRCPRAGHGAVPRRDARPPAEVRTRHGAGADGPGTPRRLDGRPYRVSPEPNETTADQPGVPVLAYHGSPLSAAEEQQVRLYIDFLRTQARTRTPSASPAGLPVGPRSAKDTE